MLCTLAVRRCVQRVHSPWLLFLFLFSYSHLSRPKKRSATNTHNSHIHTHTYLEKRRTGQWQREGVMNKFPIWIERAVSGAATQAQKRNIKRNQIESELNSVRCLKSFQTSKTKKVADWLATEFHLKQFLPHHLQSVATIYICRLWNDDADKSQCSGCNLFTSFSAF